MTHSKRKENTYYFFANSMIDLKKAPDVTPDFRIELNNNNNNVVLLN